MLDLKQNTGGQINIGALKFKIVLKLSNYPILLPVKLSIFFASLLCLIAFCIVNVTRTIICSFKGDTTKCRFKFAISRGVTKCHKLTKFWWQ